MPFDRARQMNVLLAAWVPISHILDKSLLPFGPRGWEQEIRHGRPCGMEAAVRSYEDIVCQ